jgi:hypothetical protein
MDHNRRRCKKLSIELIRTQYSHLEVDQAVVIYISASTNHLMKSDIHRTNHRKESSSGINKEYQPKSSFLNPMPNPQPFKIPSSNSCRAFHLATPTLSSLTIRCYQSPQSLIRNRWATIKRSLDMA